MGRPLYSGLASARWLEGIVHRALHRAARRLPQMLSERLEEEWSADLTVRTRPLSRLGFVLGCYWAAWVIGREPGMVQAQACVSPTWERHMTAMAYPVAPLFPRRGSVAAHRAALSDINITPLIDVMLVLLVTLIVSLPVMTHAVRLDMPRGPAMQQKRPEVISLDIDFDGTVVWNGTVMASMEQLETDLRAAARKYPQPEIHLHPDRRVRYDHVARVLAAVQRNRLRNMGFVNTGEFGD